jgi:hypothetical protein
MLSPRKVIFAVAAIAGPLLAHADLLGTTVTGQYYPMGSSPGVFNTSINYFNPANGYVPAGYGNSSSATATITDPGIEFAAVSGGGTLTDPGITGYATDFTGSTVTLTQYNNWPGTLSGFEQIFTDPAFAGLTVTKTSDDFANGPFMASLVGDTLTLSIAPNCLIGSGCSGWGKEGVASWSLTPVPLPAAAWLMLSGLTGLGAMVRKRRSA